MPVGDWRMSWIDSVVLHHKLQDSRSSHPSPTSYRQLQQRFCISCINIVRVTAGQGLTQAITKLTEYQKKIHYLDKGLHCRPSFRRCPQDMAFLQMPVGDRCMSLIDSVLLPHKLQDNYSKHSSLTSNHQLQQRFCIRYI